jgi:hypothetical protein
VKKAAIVLIALVIVAGGILAYAAVNTQLKVILNNAHMTPAAQLKGEFDRWMNALNNNSVQGTAFVSAANGTAEEYGFLVYSVTLKNNGLLPAEMAEVQVSPVQGDVLAYSSQASLGQNVNHPITVPPGEEEMLQLVLLTKSDSHAVRDIIITYYIWGHPFLVKVTYG